MSDHIAHFTYEFTHHGIRITGYHGPRSQSRVIVPAIIEGQPVTEIGEGVFYAAEHIQTVELPWTLKVIGRQAFRDCTGLKRINIPEGVQIINDSAFKICPELTSVVLPQSLRVMGHEAFMGCLKLKRVTFRSRETEINPAAFFAHNALTFICFPNSSAWEFQEQFESEFPIQRIPFEDSTPSNQDYYLN